jgi:hypothetical protein
MKYSLMLGYKDVYQLQNELGSNLWPQFMQHDKIVEEHWPDLYTHFLKFQFALFDNNKIVGVANSICLNWSKPLTELPDTGLDWAMQKARQDHLEGLSPNLQVGVQILIHPDYRNQGISYTMLGMMKDIAKANEIKHIALPVRPNLKSDFPMMDMQEYITRKNEDDLPFDPWVRVHVKDGGQIIGICSKSMTIEGSISDWENWTGKKFHESGEYIIDKALVPVKMNKSHDRGTYIEPNVWILHEIH